MAQIQKQLRLNDEHRKETILDAALSIAESSGFDSITRDVVAEKASCGLGTVNSKFGTMAVLRKEVIAHAVNRLKSLNESHDYPVGLLRVVAQGLLTRDKSAVNAPSNIKQAATNSLI